MLRYQTSQQSLHSKGAWQLHEKTFVQTESKEQWWNYSDTILSGILSRSIHG